MKIARILLCAIAISAVALIRSASADPTCTWVTAPPIETSGQDVSQDPASPLLDNDCIYYTNVFQITQVEVAIVAPDQWEDITAQAAPAATNGINNGSLPMTIYDQVFSYTNTGPDYSFSAQVNVNVDGNGSSHFSVTAVTLSGVQGLRLTISATGTAMRYLTTAVGSGNGTLLPASDWFAKNSVVDLTAQPDAGWRVQSWTGTNDDASLALTNQVTVDYDKSVSVQFEPAPSPSPTSIPSPSPSPSPVLSPTPSPTPLSYTLSAASDNGAVAKSPDYIYYIPGTTVTLTVTPNIGFHFDHWFGNNPESQLTPAQALSNPLDILMNSNKSLTAVCLSDAVTTSLMRDYLTGRANLTAGQKTSADVNGDSRLDIADLMRMIFSGGH